MKKSELQSLIRECINEERLLTIRSKIRASIRKLVSEGATIQMIKESLEPAVEGTTPEGYRYHRRMIKINGKEVSNIDVDGIRGFDYPEFSDAFVSSAEFDDGTPLTDEQIDQMWKKYPDDVQDWVHRVATERYLNR